MCCEPKLNMDPPLPPPPVPSADTDPPPAPPTECPLCLEPAKDPCVTVCGHEFCAACLRRAFRSRPPWSRGTCPLCRAPCSLYSTRSQATGRALEAPDVATIFGSAFLQRGMPGAASYHFDGPDDCYIDYTRAPSECTRSAGCPGRHASAGTRRMKRARILESQTSGSGV